MSTEPASNPKFDEFIKKLGESLALAGCLTPISQLNDITKTDARNWLDNFVKGYSFDQDDLDDLLQVGDKPFRTYKMKEVNKLIKSWLKKNLFSN